MKKLLLILLSIILLAVLIFLPTMSPAEELVDETENNEGYTQLSRKDEGKAFDDQYWIVAPPQSENGRQISVSIFAAFGWEDWMNWEDLENAFPRYFDDLDDDDRKWKIDIQTAEGKPVTRVRVHEVMFDGLYILDSDSFARRCGWIMSAGAELGEAINVGLKNEDYVFTVEMELIAIWVRYSENSITTKRLVYNFENVSSVRLEVSNIDSKEVRCFIITETGEIEVFPQGQPKNLLDTFRYVPVV